MQVSIEQVLRWNPDVVITIDPNFYALARSHPMWRELPAIKAGRFYLAPSLPFGWIDFPPSINRLIGLRWLARILYPQTLSRRTCGRSCAISTPAATTRRRPKRSSTSCCDPRG